MTEEIDSLFHQQLKTWPLLAKGVEGLSHAETRSVRLDWFDVFIRHIPHRVRSTTAAVDSESIKKRSCFLCDGNLDPEQKGVLFGSEFTVYCNPFPIVDRHLTVVHRKHQPQRIAGQLPNMLNLAAALPGFFVIYNGPECGASAPDHLHFQAGSRELFPIEQDTADMEGVAITGYARNVFLFRGTDATRMADELGSAIELLGIETGKRSEPLINIATFFDAAKGWTVYLFPRGKHRPRVYETGELTVSPASIDLCGIFVVPLHEDFARISGEDIQTIFEEVTLPTNQFQAVAARLEQLK